MKRLWISQILIFACIVAHGYTVCGENDGSGVRKVSDNEKYRLYVNGDMTEVMPFKHYHYASFDMDSPVRIVLTRDQGIETCDISPHHRGIRATVSGNSVSFMLERTGYVMLRINETERFFIFADRPSAIPSNAISISEYGVTPDCGKDITDLVMNAIGDAAQKKKTLLFPAGVYICGQLRLPTNTHLHLCKGAVVYANPENIAWYESTDDVKTRRFIYMKDAGNIKITGRGIINGNGAALRESFADKARMRLILAVNCDNIFIEGVMLQDPGSWNTHILKCKNITIRNVKLMNDTEISNTDGFDPDGVRNMLIEDCFAYCSDDNVAVKTTGNSGYIDDVDGVTVRGCVFLTKKSSLKVGTETKGQHMRNITFENNDVIESDRGMALYVSDGALINNISYIGNRFERNYKDAKQAAIHFVVNRRNANSRLGRMDNILIKDCIYETAFPKKSEIKYPGPDNGIDVTIENLIIEKRKVLSESDADLSVGNATIVFK